VLILTEDAMGFNIELLILAGLSTLFTLIAWNDDPKDGIIRSAIAFFLWSTTSLWWMWETAGTEQVQFMYIFWMLALVSIMIFLSKVMQSYKYVGKKGAWM